MKKKRWKYKTNFSLKRIEAELGVREKVSSEKKKEVANPAKKKNTLELQILAVRFAFNFYA